MGARLQSIRCSILPTANPVAQRRTIHPTGLRGLCVGRSSSTSAITDLARQATVLARRCSDAAA